MTRRYLACVSVALAIVVAAAIVLFVSGEQKAMRSEPLQDGLLESTMARYTPDTLGDWSYTRGLYLYGMYVAYRRTHDKRYLKYIKAWVDRFVDDRGDISNSFNSLDSMLPGRLLVILHHETGQSRYRIAAQKIRDRLNTYPRTTDGGFWHMTNKQHQLWSDGVFMVSPFLVEYGQEFNDATYASNEATRQLLVYASHLKQSNGLMRHAYDESRAQAWADPLTGLSPEFWCRAVGWFGMATIDVLEVIPPTHPQRDQLITIVRDMLAGFARYQDPATGRWFQVVDKGSQTDNWTETSCSSMYTFITSRAVERGYVDARFGSMAIRGYQGVLAKVFLGSDGLTNITDISVGTGVGDYSYYINRKRATNDFHGLGAFVIMSEQMIRTGAGRAGWRGTAAGHGPPGAHPGGARSSRNVLSCGTSTGNDLGGGVGITDLVELCVAIDRAVLCVGAKVR